VIQVTVFNNDEHTAKSKTLKEVRAEAIFHKHGNTQRPEKMQLWTLDLLTDSLKSQDLILFKDTL
jgi:hypothetical protein